MKRKFSRFRTYNIRINGQPIDINLARIRYRCRQCLGELEFYNSGLACAADKSHHGFIGQQEAEREQRKRNELLSQVEAVYEIKNGQIVVKESNNGN